MLEVHGVSKTFDGFSAVDRVDFSIARGEIAAVIGPNGAGKSTFFNLITGHLRPDVGRILLKERDITGAPPHRICLMGMGRSFQRTNIFPKLTVFENVQAAFITHRRRGANFWGLSDRLYRAETDALLASLGLADKANALSGALSHGNQKQVELGIALACDPEILLLDEPTAGMSAAETRETIRLLERIAAERSLTLLFTEHDMEVVFSIAQKIAVLHQGRLIAEGNTRSRAAKRGRPPGLSGRAALTALLEVRDLHTAYGEARVLFGVSLQVAPGECVCLLGRNGVGKTTTLRSIMGLTPPSRGSVLWRGRPITGWAPHRVARLGIGFVPEDRRIFAELTTWENLDVARRVSGRTGPWTIESVCELFPKLDELRDRQGGFLSGGEQQMLTIARTLMLNPRTAAAWTSHPRVWRHWWSTSCSSVSAN